jgi:hypothetical protein
MKHNRLAVVIPVIVHRHRAALAPRIIVMIADGADELHVTCRQVGGQHLPDDRDRRQLAGTPIEHSASRFQQRCLQFQQLRREEEPQVLLLKVSIWTLVTASNPKE